MSTGVCEHGSLARVCLVCELTADLAEMTDRADRAEAALRDTDWRAIRALVDGTSLPMDMQPSRERWLRQIDRLATLATTTEEGGE